MATNGTFPAKLRAELVRQGLGVRTLARKMDPAQPERSRRSLNRWLNEGIKPSPANRVAVAVALGLPEDAFTGEEDDEEDAELVAATMNLVRLLKTRAREEMLA